MNRLNDPNNYFNASALGGALDSTVNYMIVFYDVKGSALATYHGTIYYYNTAQKIHYNHLAADLVARPHILTHGEIEQVNYVAQVKLFNTNSATAKATANIILTPAADWRGDGLTDEDFEPMQTEMKVFLPADAEKPRVAAGMVYPLAVAVDPLESPSDYTAHVGVTSYSLTSAADGLPFVLGVTVPVASSLIVAIGAASPALPIVRVIYPVVCDAAFMVLWWDCRGFWQCQPFNGQDTLTAERQEITNTARETSVYRATARRGFALKSDFAHLQSTYETLITSPAVYIFNTANNKTQRVLVKPNSHTNKAERGAKQIEITVEYAGTSDYL